MDENTRNNLFQKYKKGTLTEPERALLESWYLYRSQNEQVHLTEAETSYQLQQLRKSIPYLSTKKKVPKRWYYAAASFILLASFSIWFYLFNYADHSSAKSGNSASTYQAVPGSPGATLVLSNGERISLKQDTLSLQLREGASSLYIDAHAGLSYSQSTENSLEPPVYNTLITARGQQSPYPLMLSDGTKVWLNAASSITFPTAFTGKERVVRVKGEAYFEVAGDSERPFMVDVENQNRVEVLGTRFNINAYEDEPAVLTTLLAGSVRVTAMDGQMKKKSVVMRPGQQAQTRGGEMDLVYLENAGEVIAWKNGLFEFNGAEIAHVIRQLSRWYNVDMEIKGNFKRHFSGTMSKDAPISESLTLLELTGEVTFKQEGDKIIAAAQ